VRRRLGSLWPPLLVGVGVLVLWELIIDVVGIEEFLLPRPLDVWSALGEDWSVIFAGAKKTAWVAVSGLAAGVVVAVVAAFVCTRSKLLAEAVTPLAAALAATPIVALAPVYFKWFGSIEPTAKQAVVMSVVLFPVFVSTSRGLLEVDETHVELMHTYAAGEWRVLREVRVPNAMPFFLTSLKVAASLSVIAAIVSEYFGGEQGTLGGIITQSAGLTRYDRAWAAVMAASALGIALFAFVNLLERVLLPWQPARRS
jgi:NitT/TauT family transport system permease protein